MVSLDLTIINSPTVDLGNDVSICAGDSTLLDAGSGHTNYLWNTGETTQTIYADTAGTYSVTVGNGASVTNSNSLSFDGSNSTVNISNNTITGNNSFVVAFDLFTSNLPSDDIGDPDYTVLSQGTGGQWSIHYNEENGTLRFQLKTSTWYFTEIPILENTWYRVVGQYNKLQNTFDLDVHY